MEQENVDLATSTKLSKRLAAIKKGSFSFIVYSTKSNPLTQALRVKVGDPDLTHNLLTQEM